MLALSPCSPTASQRALAAQTDAFGPDEDGRTFFSAAQLPETTVRIDDFVLVDLEGAPRSVMQISVMWQQPNMPIQGEFRRLFRPEETFEGRKPYHGELELLLSTELVVLPLNAISASTRVESYSTFCHRQHFSQGVHYFTSSEYYDPNAGRVHSKPSQCLLVSPLRDRLAGLPKTRRPLPSLTPDASSNSVAHSPPPAPVPAVAPRSPVPASLPLPATPCIVDAPLAAPVAAASPDSPNAPGQEAADSPGARDTAAAPCDEPKSRFTGELVPTAALVRMREEDAEAERRANEVMARLKRRAAAIEELLGSPERPAGELACAARTSSAKKSPRSPTKKAAKAARPMRTLQFAVVK